MDAALWQIMDALSNIRCSAACSEEELHEQVAYSLAQAGIEAVHEAVIGTRCRIDFLAGDIGIEIKKSKPDKARLTAQLARYAACDRVGQIIVVAPRGVDLPGRIAGKKITMLALERLWGICLPS